MGNNAIRIMAMAISFALAGPLPHKLKAEADGGAGVGGGTEAAPMSTAELRSLVAPIALYPDGLVAEILAAATFPDQVAVANYWIQQNKTLSGSALRQAVDRQTWDASVKGLTAFPSVLDNLANNLNWTSSLGEAYHSQRAAVMEAIQALRAQAKAAGNLKSGPQITVVQPTPQTIVIQPTNPQVVYVPEYNPAVIYGTPYVTPGYSAGEVAAAGVLGFGAGIATAALAGGGWDAWNCNWNGGAVVYNRNAYYGNSGWHGGYYNGAYSNGAYHNAYGAYGDHNAYNRAPNAAGSANRFDDLSREGERNFDRSAGSNWWAHDDSALGRSNAFSGLSGHSGGFGGFGGWASRADSFRGWGSLRTAGFGGGRFGGGRFGGGGFHGGFRR
jgi:hypothetical protein